MIFGASVVEPTSSPKLYKYSLINLCGGMGGGGGGVLVARKKKEEQGKKEAAKERRKVKIKPPPHCCQAPPSPSCRQEEENTKGVGARGYCAAPVCATEKTKKEGGFPLAGDGLPATLLATKGSPTISGSKQMLLHRRRGLPPLETPKIWGGSLLLQKEENKRRKKQWAKREEKGRSTLTKVAPPVTSKTSDVELGVPSTQPD